MPEVKGRAELSGGFFIARVLSPGAMAAAAAAPRPRRPRKLSPEDNKENVAPQGCGRRRRSPLPVWYPRTPLRDVTTIVQVLEARRARLRAELARAAQQRRLSIETSPEVPPSVSPTPQQDEITATPSDPSAPSDASPSSPPPAATITPLPPQSELQESSPVLRTSASPTNASPAAPQRTPETHPMLCGKINEIEKSVKAYMKKAPKQPAKKIVARRNLMSMR